MLRASLLRSFSCAASLRRSAAHCFFMCRIFVQRWGMAAATEQSTSQHTTIWPATFIMPRLALRASLGPVQEARAWPDLAHEATLGFVVISTPRRRRLLKGDHGPKRPKTKCASARYVRKYPSTSQESIGKSAKQRHEKSLDSISADVHTVIATQAISS